MTETTAIPAADLQAGHALIGDSISPTRYGTGIAVKTVSVEATCVYAVLANGPTAELLDRETVYVTQPQRWSRPTTD